jgi:mannose-6-phosphate isomerase-like protein (cupin superfamily)
MKTSLDAIRPYVTKDGSLIRELLHPAVHGNSRLSLAEAVVEPGAATELHCHHRAEEIYHVLAGTGWMTLGAEQFSLAPGDTVCIPPGQPHRVGNTGRGLLRILCCCAPAYAHDDTELLS